MDNDSVIGVPAFDRQLATFLAAPTPRTAPPELRRAAYRQAAPILLAVMGAIFMFFPLLIVPISPSELFQDRALERGERTTGRVVAVVPTSSYISKQQVIRYRFSFTDASGTLRQGECFTTGARWNEGESVTVRYLEENPDVSCIDGARLSQGIPFELLLTAVAAGLVIWPLWSRRRMRQLLERGELVKALITAIEPTKMKIGGRAIHRVSLKPLYGPGEFDWRQHDSRLLAFARERLKSKRPVLVLQDPARPKLILLPECF